MEEIPDKKMEKENERERGKRGNINRHRTNSEVCNRENVVNMK